MKKIIKFSTVLLLLSILFIACEEDREDFMYKGAAFYSFINNQSGTFYVQDNPDATYSIEIGTTVKPDQNKSVTYTVLESSTAVAGTHYNIASSVITIPANEVIGNLVVQGLYSGFGSEPVTLDIQLTGDGITPYDTLFSLTLRKYCPFDINNFVGTWNVHDISLYDDEYSYQITTEPDAENPNGLIIHGLWEADTPVKITFDASDPANFFCIIPDQHYDDHSAYGEMRISDMGSGIFSSCDKTVTTSYMIYVAAGYFDQVNPSEWVYAGSGKSQQPQNKRKSLSLK